MDTDDLEELNRITEKIIGCAMTVINTLGCGFLEKVYENALCIELRKAGLTAEQQKPLAVYYDGINVGNYAADVIVNGVIIVELKTAKNIDEGHEAQTLNYLRATRFRIGLILNFGKPRLGIRRMIL
jgi:GxxExxY protein